MISLLRAKVAVQLQMKFLLPLLPPCKTRLIMQPIYLHKIRLSNSLTHWLLIPAVVFKIELQPPLGRPKFLVALWETWLLALGLLTISLEFPTITLGPLTVILYPMLNLPRIYTTISLVRIRHCKMPLMLVKIPSLLTNSVLNQFRTLKVYCRVCLKILHKIEHCVALLSNSNQILCSRVALPK